MKVTAKMLRKAHACEREVNLFEKEWPQGMVVNEANLERAIALGLDVDYGARRLLPAELACNFLEATRARYSALVDKFAERWRTKDAMPGDANSFWRDYYNSVIPNILRAAKEMDDVRLSSVEAKAGKGKK